MAVTRDTEAHVGVTENSNRLDGCCPTVVELPRKGVRLFANDTNAADGGVDRLPLETDPR